MTTKQAIKVISDHQKWRMGDDKIKPTVPSKLSEALDIAINIMSKSEIKICRSCKKEVEFSAGYFICEDCMF